MIPLATFQILVERCRALGYADGDITWAENVKHPENADEFALAIAHVIVHSGMRNTVADLIWFGDETRTGIRACLLAGHSASLVFQHRGKVAAIDGVWRQREERFAVFTAAEDKLAWLAELPGLGPVTKFHAAKSLGLDYAKPDVHLKRLATLHKTTAQDLCADLARQTGLRIGTIDVVLWRACANKLINSTTGEFAPWPPGTLQ